MGNNRKRDRFDALAPRDVVATLRSLERRFGSVSHRAANPELADVVERPGPSGSSLDVLIANAARGAALVAGAVDTTLDAVDPVIAAPVLEPSERAFTDDRAWSIEAGVETLAAEANRAADRVDDATADSLSRAVAVTGDGSTSPLAVAQQLARELIAALSAAEQHVEWLESQA